MNNTSLNSKEKEELFFQDEDYGLDFSFVLKYFILCVFFVFLFGSFIFVRYMIYQGSKEYSELVSKKNILNEENKELKRKIEALQFKNKITNYFEVNYDK
ncbi:hypothetical protein [Campylobacter canadensis]|uniref:Septum formation initiator n=1 Tax=Campylobacter canadensis TaxID=449520 RepID=A0ABS7WRF8_9BACT|nr:hypothetical protein [Campylobacter canadensis]MBZ7987308.1 hypothetical protein [Campylobacter canadensis]MBZ7994389.1 hypothetical protein [Campylobacter canadensis]MBZ7996085.1 hypothetical protein [Campylobacter canadensis]MBZ7998263.1 hypothetical protein [Campylobacter canadensis]MBZ7999721.1 hypothetical protein [Campylobacter canadensis]